MRFLGCQGLALRGSENEKGNLVQLLHLRANDLPILKDWLVRPTTWTSWATQNEVVEIMSHEILRSIFSEVRANKFFTVLADETGDISRVEQLVIMIRHVSCELEVSEDLLGLHSLERSDSETI